MTMDELIAKLGELIGNLGWDYDRMSQSGQAIYGEICVLMAKLMEGGRHEGM